MGGMIQPIAGPLGPYDDFIRQAAEQNGLDPNMLHALIQQESAMNPNAVSPKGAMGLGQLMPGTAQDLGVTDPFNPAQNIGGAGKYLGQMGDMFGHDPRMMLAGYNAGPGNVQKYGGIPPFDETQNYVENIMGKLRPRSAPAPDFGMNPMQDVPPMPAQYESVVNPAANRQPVTLESSYTGNKLAPGAISAEEFNSAPMSASRANSVGNFFRNPTNAAMIAGTALGTDWEDPSSIGAGVGGLGGAFAGSALGSAALGGLAAASTTSAGAAATGATIGSALPGIGTVIGAGVGAIGGSALGGLFGDSSEEKAQKEAKKKKEEQYLLASMRRTSDMMRQGQLDRRAAMDNITRYLQQTNAA